MKRTVIQCVAIALLLFSSVMPDRTSAQVAATIVVTTVSDVIAADGQCSLREAVIAANTDTSFSDCPAGSGADTIEFGAGLPSPITIVLTTTGANENNSYTGDLDIYLFAPNQESVLAVQQRNPNLQDYIRTVLIDGAATLIDDALSDPFTGQYRPHNPLSNFDGLISAGNWQLFIVDSAVGDSGALYEWGLEICGAATGPQFQPWVVMVLPPGGFFVLGAWLLLFEWLRRRRGAGAAPRPPEGHHHAA